jgi:RHS repeat-associated protein
VVGWIGIRNHTATWRATRSQTDENGNTTNYTYDLLNRQTQVTFPGNILKTFTYDPLGRLTSAQNQNIGYTMGYDQNGRLTGITDTNGRAIAYAYDALNRKTQMTTPDGRTIAYGYDADSRLTQLQAGIGTFAFSYDLLGRRTGLSYPNGDTTSYSYSAASNLTSINIVNSQQAIINSFTHTFDNVGNKTSVTDNAGPHSYTYDPTYQLTQAVHPSPQPTEQYSYDPVGNRTGTTVNSDNELLDDGAYTYAYDLNGNMTSMTEQATGITTTYGYDYENRLVTATSPGMTAQYKYDPFGRRIEKIVSGTITKYFYDGPSIIDQYDGSGAIIAAYLQDLAIDNPLSVTQSGATYFFHKDSLGTVTDLTDNAGATIQTYTYDSFGNIVSTTGTLAQPFTFTGREFDHETGLYYYRARYYDPMDGRFISEDPIGLMGGINEFSYAGNNAMNFVDPMGLFNLTPSMSDNLTNYARGGGNWLAKEADQRSNGPISPQTWEAIALMGGVPIGVALAPEAAAIVLMHPEWANRAAEFLSSYMPGPPAPTVAGYAGSFTSFVQGEIGKRFQGSKCK